MKNFKYSALVLTISLSTSTYSFGADSHGWQQYRNILNNNYPVAKEEISQKAITTAVSSPGTLTSTWTMCANEGGICNFTGTLQVKYGANTSFAYKTATSSIACNNTVFGDPLYGTPKSCYYATTTSPTPAPTPSPTIGIYTTTNNVIADMNTPGEGVAINPQFNWQRYPVITTYAPRGDAIASWWTGNRPTWTYTALSWFTAFEAQGNYATNSRVEIRNLRMYFLSQSTRQWSKVDISVAPRMGLWTYPFNSAGNNTGERLEADGGKSIKPTYPNFHHGYGNAYLIKNPADVRATFVAMDFRLVVGDANKNDDRSLAKYVVDVGGDYYPGNPNYADTTMSWSLGYAPGMGNGRYLLATPDWRTATMIVPNTAYGSTLEELSKNPPPLN